MDQAVSGRHDLPPGNSRMLLAHLGRHMDRCFPDQFQIAQDSIVLQSVLSIVSRRYPRCTCAPFRQSAACRRYTTSTRDDHKSAVSRQPHDHPGNNGVPGRNELLYFTKAYPGSPTLKVALGHFCRLSHLEDTFVQSWLSIDGDTAKLHKTNFYPLDQQGLRNEDWAELFLLITVVRAFAGASWTPQVMGFRSDGLTSRFASETFPDTRILTGQTSAFITLSRGLLGMPPRRTGKRSETCPNDARPVDQHWDFAGSLSQVLAAYLIDGAPTIQLAAKLADTSVRTLQRRLAQVGLSYSELLKQARFEVASTMLRNTDRKIIDIAYELGYTDPAHFTRAFGRLAGMSPCEYRGQRKLQ